jgi:hypothetical protein
MAITKTLSFLPVKVANGPSSDMASEIKVLLPNDFQCAFASSLAPFRGDE